MLGCLFGGVKLAKNADPDKYVYGGYGIGFDKQIKFSWPDGSVGKNYRTRRYYFLSWYELISAYW